MKKLNYGSGDCKLEGFINVDIEESQKPDLICDLRKQPLPFENDEIDVIYCIHNIEHIEMKYWPQFFVEFHRVLKPEGELVFAYPEFERAAKFFIENYKGRRDYFRNVLYGRQLWKGDYHVVPMVTSELIQFLQENGFHNFKQCEDTFDPCYTFLQCHKGTRPLSYEDVIRKEIFHV